MTTTATKAIYKIVHGALITFALVIAGVLIPGTAAAASYYTATSGSDSNPGTITQPFRTITKGLSVMVAGDTLYVRGGTYPGITSDTTALPSGTSWSNPITIAAYSSEVVHISGGINTANPTNRYIIFNGLTVHNQVRIASGANHIRHINCDISGALHDASGVLIPQHAGSDYNEFINCKIHDNGDCAVSCTSGTVGHGLYIATSNNLIDGVESYNNGHLGIQIYASNTTTPSNNIIRNSSFHHNQTAYKTSGQGITVGVGDNNLVYNNLVYSNLGGIDLGYGGTNTKIYNNTVYGNRDYGLQIRNTSGASVVNNIVYQTGTAISNSGTNTTLSSNLTTNPSFVNAAAADFRLQPGSTALDQGVALSAVTVDRTGLTRPQGARYDIGAYEYASSTSLPAAPTDVRILR